MAAQPGCCVGGVPGHPGLRCSRPLCTRLTTAAVACKCSSSWSYRGPARVRLHGTCERFTLAPAGTLCCGGSLQCTCGCSTPCDCCRPPLPACMRLACRRHCRPGGGGAAGTLRQRAQSQRGGTRGHRAGLGWPPASRSCGSSTPRLSGRAPHRTGIQTSPAGARHVRRQDGSDGRAAGHNRGAQLRETTAAGQRSACPFLTCSPFQACTHLHHPAHHEGPTCVCQRGAGTGAGQQQEGGRTAHGGW